MAIYVGDKRYGLYVGDKRRRYMGASGGGEHPLPSGAVPIEYLAIGSSPNRGFIDTGITPDASTIAQIKVMSTVVSRTIIFGYQGSNDTNDWRLFNNSSKIYFDTYNNTRLIGGNNSFVINQIYEFELGNFYVKDIPTDTVLVSGNTYSGTGLAHICLFGDSTARLSSSRFYYVKIISGTTFLRDMIPIRIGQVGYMFDKVSGQLFGNQMNENFILGPDLTE